MNLSKYLPLTETTFYIMMALTQPGHGYAIMQEVEKISKGRVRIAAGTMYGAIDNLLKQKLIKSVKSDDPRRKVYEISEIGKEILELEVVRLKELIIVYNEIDNNGGSDNETI